MKKRNIFRRVLDAALDRKPVAKREFSGAQLGSMFADWFAQQTNADAEIRRDISTLRNRARSLERDNDYVRKYLSLLDNNVIGSGGIALQMKVLKRGDAINEIDSGKIEDAWKAWGKRGNCTLDGRMSWVEAQRVILRTVARDGECIIRLHRGAPNKGRFAISLIEADHLDHTIDGTLGANVVVMGVELDRTGKPVAYHLRSRHPGDAGAARTDNLEVVPASDIIHAYRADRPGQTRGYTWLSAAITRLRQLQEYEVAEVIAARVGACKMGFFTQENGGEYVGEKDASGALITDATPGAFERLPAGVGFQQFTPDHPSTAYPVFIKGALRGIAAGLQVSYNDLANDLEGVNYSSIRAGLLEVREHYKALQSWYIETVCIPIFEAWLRQVLISGETDFSAGDFTRLNQPSFKGRRWPWVDPQSDITAASMAIAQGFTSRRAVVAENGGDFWEVCNEQKADAELCAEKGVSFPQPHMVQGVVNDAKAEAEPDDSPDELAPGGNG